MFLIPVFLLRLYIRRGIIKHEHSSKYGALYIFTAAVVTTIICLIIQYFIDKARPETALTNAGSLIMQHLPTRSFPSDHASVSRSVAIAALIRGRRKMNGKIQARGWLLLACSILMSRARVTVGVHRPTDILVGRLVGTIGAFIVFRHPMQHFCKRVIFNNIVRVEEWILGAVGVYGKKKMG